MAGYSTSSSPAAPPSSDADRAGPAPTAKWMWGDAGVVKLVARLNPARWSPERNIEEVVADLQSYVDGDDGNRPVIVDAWDGWGSKVVQHHASPEAAVSDLRGLLSISTSHVDGAEPASFQDANSTRPKASLTFLASQSVSMVKWMWSDAGFIPALANMNPSRWSRLQSVEDTIDDLEKYVDAKGCARGVKMEVHGGRANAAGTVATTIAPSIPEAIEGLKKLLAEQEARGDSAGSSNAAAQFLPGLAGGTLAAVCGIRTPYTAALTAFGVQHADMDWISAHAAARRVAAVPFNLHSEQEQAGRGAHPQVQNTWADYVASDAKRYADAFLQAAQTLPDERPRVITATLDGKHEEAWKLVGSDNERYWCIYAIAERYVLVFPGGDGSTESNKEAPGSCGRRLIARDYTRPEESVPLELVKRLCIPTDRKIVVMGYSNGCIPLLTVASILGRDPHLQRFIQYNPAMLFAPEWLTASLPADWWVNAPDFSTKMDTWAILDDPLGSGIPERRGWQLPRPPGTTHLLPAVAGFPWVANHSLIHFLEPPASS